MSTPKLLFGDLRDCAGCQKEINIAKELFLLRLGKYWHDLCFRCKTCESPIPNCKFIASADDAWHESCYSQLDESLKDFPSKHTKQTCCELCRGLENELPKQAKQDYEALVPNQDEKTINDANQSDEANQVPSSEENVGPKPDKEVTNAINEADEGKKDPDNGTSVALKSAGEVTDNADQTDESKDTPANGSDVPKPAENVTSDAKQDDEGEQKPANEETDVPKPTEETTDNANQADESKQTPINGGNAVPNLAESVTDDASPADEGKETAAAGENTVPDATEQPSDDVNQADVANQAPGNTENEAPKPAVEAIDEANQALANGVDEANQADEANQIPANGENVLPKAAEVLTDDTNQISAKDAPEEADQANQVPANGVDVVNQTVEPNQVPGNGENVLPKPAEILTNDTNQIIPKEAKEPDQGDQAPANGVHVANQVDEASQALVHGENVLPKLAEASTDDTNQIAAEEAPKDAAQADSPPLKESIQLEGSGGNVVVTEEDKEVNSGKIDYHANVDGYVLKSELISTHEIIKANYGDVTKDVTLCSTLFKFNCLEAICSIVLRLQNTAVDEFNELQLKEMLDEVVDMERVRFNVSWLHNHLLKLKNIMELKAAYGMLEKIKESQAKIGEVLMNSIQLKEEELTKLRVEYAEARAKYDQFYHEAQVIKSVLEHEEIATLVDGLFEAK